MAGSTSKPKHGDTLWHRIAGRRKRLVVGAIALILGVIFIVENQSRVRIHFIFFTVSSRLWVGFLVSVALGALLGQAVGVYRGRARRSGSTSGGHTAP